MDASQEVRWLRENLAAASLSYQPCSAVRGTRSYAFACLTKPRGRRTLAEAEGKREVGTNDEEVKQIDNKHDKKKFTPLLFMSA